MRDHELPELLHRATDEVGDPDVAESTWAQGRAARRRRWSSRAVGGLAAAGVVGLLALQVVGSEAEAPGVADPAASGTGTDGRGQHLLRPSLVWDQDLSTQPADQPLDPALVGEWLEQESLHVWMAVYSGCLESRGYTVTTAGPSLSVTQQGVVAGEYERDSEACRAELVTDAPAVVPPLREASAAERARLSERYFQYYWTRQCLLESDVPTGDLMPAEDFIAGLARSQLPPWHPYQEAAEQGLYAQARDACPIWERRPR